ncbi:MAG TPA: TetR/AcrR family transcriptional regulator [Spirochaetota bacterium]|nr:TetR/AcrR family transcriptional regulator [Spirochaetota bacterium]
MKARQNAELRKPEILKSFYDILIEEGIEGVSIAKIAKRMGIHPSLIMHYFSTKEKLVIAAVDRIVREYGILIEGMESYTTDPVRRLERLVDILVGDEWYRMTGIAADFSVISISFRNSEIDERVRRLYARYKKFLAGEFLALGEAGIIGRRDPRRTAEIVMSLLEGYRHFKHFYVSDEDAESYRRDIKRSVLTLLGSG